MSEKRDWDTLDEHGEPIRKSKPLPRAARSVLAEAVRDAYDALAREPGGILAGDTPGPRHEPRKPALRLVRGGK